MSTECFNHGGKIHSECEKHQCMGWTLDWRVEKARGGLSAAVRSLSALNCSPDYLMFRGLDVPSTMKWNLESWAKQTFFLLEVVLCQSIFYHRDRGRNGPRTKTKLCIVCWELPPGTSPRWKVEALCAWFVAEKLEPEAQPSRCPPNNCES